LYENRCVSHVPIAVGSEPAHFDILLARSAITQGSYLSNDWLVLKLQELIALSYQVLRGLRIYIVTIEILRENCVKFI
jgi:hypothetical protein